MKNYILSIFLVSNFLSVVAQQLPTIIPQSPEATALAKYCEFPVSNYTGVPDINLPLFTVQSGDLSIPIQLNYNAAGFRVAEEASWVGLGWTLSTNAMISRTIHGIDDFQGGLLNANTSVSVFYLSSGNPKIIDITGGESEDYPWACIDEPSNGDNGFNNGSLCKGDYSFCRSNYPTVNGEISQTNYFEDYLPRFDWEPDAFFMNFFGYNNMFVYDQDQHINFVNKSDVQIKKTANGWSARSHDGFEYLFEKSIIARNWFGNEVSSEWCLTKIITPMKHEAQFFYSNFDPSDFTNLIESYAYNEHAISLPNGAGPMPHYVIPSDLEVTRFLKNYLEKIVLDNGTYITFTRDGSRDDLKNGEKLRYIRIYDSNNKLVREFELVTDYFSSNSNQRGFFTDMSASDYSYYQKRLRLSAVIEHMGTESKTFSFEYSNIRLPNKDSYQQDHWGFYNNNSSNSLIPSYEGKLYYRYSQHPFGDFRMHQKYTGADRDPDTSRMKACILTKINYPTGGFSAFKFEANDYLLPDPIDYYGHQLTCESDADPNYTYESPSWNIRAVGSGNGNVAYYVNSEATNTVTFAFPPDNDLVELAETKIEIIVYPTGPGDIALSAAMYAEISGANFYNKVYLNDLTCANNNNPCTSYKKIIDLPNNVYGPITMKLLMPGAINPQTAVFTFSSKIVSITRGNKFAGGLRIKQITDHDPVDPTKNIIKTYQYRMPFEDENHQTAIGSTGILKKPLRYYHMLAYPAGSTSQICFTSSSYYGSGYEMGNHIGYSKIIEYSGANGEFGRTEYVYRNFKNILYNSPLRPAGVPCSYRTALDGTLYNKSIYDKDNNLLLETQSNYALLDQKIVKGIYQDYWDSGDWVYGQGGFHYYPIYTRWEALSLLTERVYDKDNSIHFIETRSNYFYNQDNLLVDSIVTYSSKNDVLRNKIYYPTDVLSKNSLPGGALSDDEFNMINQLKGTTDAIPFRTSEVIQREEWSNNILLTRQRTNYKLFSNIVQPNTVEFATNINALENRIIYNNYDSMGNLLEASKNDDINYAYIWSYNNTYPVIKAENIDYNALNTAVTSIQSNLQSYLTNTIGNLTSYQQKNAWRTFNISLRNHTSLKKALITTYTYSPLIGITSETDSNGVTTYYEYDGLGRLKCVRNDDNNIIKTYNYHYQEQQ